MLMPISRANKQPKSAGVRSSPSCRQARYFSASCSPRQQHGVADSLCLGGGKFFCRGRSFFQRNSFEDLRGTGFVPKRSVGRSRDREPINGSRRPDACGKRRRAVRLSGRANTSCGSGFAASRVSPGTMRLRRNNSSSGCPNAPETSSSRVCQSSGKARKMPEFQGFFGRVAAHLKQNIRRRKLTVLGGPKRCPTRTLRP